MHKAESVAVQDPRQLRGLSMFQQCQTLSAAALVRDRSGNVSLLFALIAIPVLGCIGLAVDFGHQTSMRTSMQQALDTAVLSGAGAGSNHTLTPDQENGAMSNLVTQRVLTAMAGTGAKPSVTVSINPAEGTITARAETTIDTLFMGLFGKEKIKISAESTAVAGAGGPMEVAIAFDTTHSMAGAKLAAAQQSASDLTDLLFHRPGSAAPNPNMKVGLVPFTRYVNVGLANRGASWLTGDADYSVAGSSCTDTWEQLATPIHHHTVATCYNDGLPYDCSSDYDDANDYSKPATSHVCVPSTANYVWHGCVGSQSSPDDAGVAASAATPAPAWIVGDWVTGECPAELTRLSGDPNAIKASIAALTEGGETYVAPGLLWGWRLLSADPLAPFHDGAAAANTRKRLILMTDGANTFSASYPLHDGTDVAAANAKTLEVCNNIKAAGIEIYAIAFDVTDPTAQTLLSQCASGPPFYYNALTVSDLQDAFHKIGRELMAMRLMK